MRLAPDTRQTIQTSRTKRSQSGKCSEAMFVTPNESEQSDSRTPRALFPFEREWVAIKSVWNSRFCRDGQNCSHPKVFGTDPAPWGWIPTTASQVARFFDRSSAVRRLPAADAREGRLRWGRCPRRAGRE